jgi:hypothetical protein
MAERQQKTSDTHQRTRRHRTRQDGRPKRDQEGRSLGIVSDQRGQIQPADRASAQKSGTHLNPEKQPSFPKQPTHGE